MENLVIIIFGISLLVGIPLFINSILKLYWIIAGKNGYSRDKDYKILIPQIMVLIFSLIALILLYCYIKILFSISGPSLSSLK